MILGSLFIKHTHSSGQHHALWQLSWHRHLISLRYATYKGRPVCVQDTTTMESQFWTELFTLMGIDVRQSSVYHLQSQGRVEKFNSVIVEALRIFCMKHDSKSWDDYLVHLEMYGRDVRTVMDLTPDDRAEDVEEVREKIMAAVDLARDALTLSAIQKEKLMMKMRKDVQFNVSDMVMLSTRDLKLHESMGKMIMAAVDLEFTPRFQHMKNTVFNVAKLRPYYFRGVSLDDSEPPPLPLIQRDGHYFEVDRILPRRGKNNRVQYLVRWKGYDKSSDDSWLSTREFRT